jgi:anti-sigma regulatory factor (Ser/Thr protein kinase)
MSNVVKEKDGRFEGGVGCFLTESFVVMVNVLKERGALFGRSCLF